MTVTQAHTGRGRRITAPVLVRLRIYTRPAFARAFPTSHWSRTTSNHFENEAERYAIPPYSREEEVIGNRLPHLSSRRAYPRRQEQGSLTALRVTSGYSYCSPWHSSHFSRISEVNETIGRMVAGPRCGFLPRYAHVLAATRLAACRVGLTHREESVYTTQGYERSPAEGQNFLAR